MNKLHKVKTSEDYISETSQKRVGLWNSQGRPHRILRRFHGATSAIERELYLDAYRWVFSDDCSWPFSFPERLPGLEAGGRKVCVRIFWATLRSVFRLSESALCMRRALAPKV